ncbi:hypothetical protein E2562_014800 [Oryza meyeriana var. granulata]|uniref:BHLH domain-containing protein n=1 Tax=Oryza meyeriana var. granulata TaxID=110450 RepID=A0A6G1BWZ3_9ORYZ|nr:hypothetical protein E2562_014800 [Oryza meyeriana var. granulata]
MALDALCSAGDVLIYDTFNASAAAAAGAPASFLFGLAGGAAGAVGTAGPETTVQVASEAAEVDQKPPQAGRRKRRRRARSCKSREDAESQRMTHIAVERNRRRQMNEYLAVLRSLMPESYVHRTRAGVADIEVSLVETHASVRVMALRRPGQLLKMVAGLHALRLTVLHLNVTALGSLALYSISVKVEEGCSMATVDDIAAAVHHVLCIIETEAAAAAAEAQLLLGGEAGRPLVSLAT